VIVTHLAKSTLIWTLIVGITWGAVLFPAIRRDPRDRVLLFECVAVVTFFAGLVLFRIVGVYWPAIIVWMVLFLGFTALTAYFGVTNWLNRRKKAN
jgi:hypothetical protein